MLMFRLTKAALWHNQTNLGSSLHTDDKLIKSPAQAVQREFVYDGNLWASLAESQGASAETWSKDPNCAAVGR